jgi:hypothetical protein
LPATLRLSAHCRAWTIAPTDAVDSVKRRRVAFVVAVVALFEVTTHS